MANHRFAINGWSHTAWYAIEQGHAKGIFQILELFRCSRLRHVEFIGGAVNVALVVESDQQQQLSGFETGAQEPVGVIIFHFCLSCLLCLSLLLVPFDDTESYIA